MAQQPDYDAEVAIVGAGVIGAAIAATLARTRAATGTSADSSVIVIERHESYGRETSSHNSGVIHAGIYYPFGSLKHRACLEGNPALYAWCAQHGVEHRRSGKLIVALDDAELDALDAVAERARGNGVPGVSRLTRAEANALEPAVPAVAALRSASSGVVDQIGLVRSFEAAAREAGALFAYRHEVLAAERDGGGFRLELRDPDGERATLRSAALVNAAGHGAPAIAAALGYPLDGAGSGDREGDGDVPRLRQTANRGRYYDVVGPGLARAVRHLIYPLPDHAGGGLGVHLTVDTDGALHLGPDTAWLDADAPLDYRADDAPRAAFLASGRRLLPALRDEDLAPGQVGYRPKLSDAGEEAADFLVWHDRGYVHLGGIESPGVTSSLPLAQRVADLLR